MIAVYKAYATMLDLILGVNCCVSVHFRDVFTLALEMQLPVIEGMFQSSLLAVLSLFLHHTQLQFTMYFNAALLRGAAAMMPDVNGLMAIIGGQTWTILPAIPANYIMPLPNPTPMTNPMNPTMGCKPREDKLVLVNNTPVEHIINCWVTYGKPACEVTTGNAAILPKDENETELCLSFHCRGQCFKEKNPQVPQH